MTHFGVTDQLFPNKLYLHWWIDIHNQELWYIYRLCPTSDHICICISNRNNSREEILCFIRTCLRQIPGMCEKDCLIWKTCAKNASRCGIFLCIISSQKCPENINVQHFPLISALFTWLEFITCRIGFWILLLHSLDCYIENFSAKYICLFEERALICLLTRVHGSVCQSFLFEWNLGSAYASFDPLFTK